LRVLFIHCDYFSYTTTKPTKLANAAADAHRSYGVKDALVAFIAVEEGDEEDEGLIISKAVEEFKVKARRLGVKNLVIYPFAHLSERLCRPERAQLIINRLSEELRLQGFAVEEAPFGWEKAFSLTTKGHPLSESLSIIKVDRE